ncbi:CcoQ/FixQ family Cbb3-type cytochrome c oxidase assembly chaperone [Lutibacter sp. TH_r2]|uniref:CcoQ/FixQ family Cbb3-type cytochrome c oxidase assembly chaperone n=1 Tax=Lutibacter sp. TH_r2 TaxID=3082083 RepID=UPI002952F2E5|nr:CcoQ/FixQ family Cbb3-type cytochrome c oxidase assembly chaperone [Lutibacter sp. TH_r2]MDV7188415.1 CcoQ/FixQ family Cbb3-type cytochrome c oxidase assembly chaperone [Lutibacter sp. TH_r2]
MLKFIKHNLSGIDGVEIYPIISLLLFFTVFVLMLIFVFKLPKKNIDEISQLPLDNTNNKEIDNE